MSYTTANCRRARQAAIIDMCPIRMQVLYTFLLATFGDWFISIKGVHIIIHIQLHILIRHEQEKSHIKVDLYFPYPNNPAFFWAFLVHGLEWTTCSNKRQR